jgi:hypothetical protein
MIHPFSEDTKALSEQELNEKIKDLSSKYFAAQRLGNNDLLTQIQTFITIYRQELQMRSLKNKVSDDKDLDSLINVE